MTPIAYLSQCFGEDGQNLGYTVWDRAVPGAIPVVPVDVALQLKRALRSAYADMIEHGLSASSEVIDALYLGDPE